MILMKNDFGVALVTTHTGEKRNCAQTITKELIQEKLMISHRCLKTGFRYRCAPYCSAFTESSCRRRGTVGRGKVKFG